jgi:riboflavin synthase
MFGWIQKWREQKVAIAATARDLIAQQGGQARHVLADHIRESEAKGQDTKELWAVMREVRKRSGDEGLDTATRFTER